MTQTYQDFLRSKMVTAQDSGVAVSPDELNPKLFPHQRALAAWAIRGGNRAIFASFGLGKTVIQIQILAKLIVESYNDECALIVCPLGVKGEFVRDARTFFDLEFKYVRTNEELADLKRQGFRFFLTNYERIRDGNLDPNHFKVVSLDEASVLRGFGGTKTFREFMRLFEQNPNIKHKFVATATPSPNDYIELLAYAAFLDVMDVGQAKTRFFKRDSTKADVLTLHPHKSREFWLWVSTWAIFLQKPSDLGPEFSDEGYELPGLDVHWHELPSDHTNAIPERGGQGRLLRNTAIGVTHAAREKRDSLDARIERMVAILNEPLRLQPQILSGEFRAGAHTFDGLVQREQAQDRPGTEEALHEGVPENVCPQTRDTGNEGREESSTAGAIRAGRGVSGSAASGREALAGAESAQTQSPAHQSVRFDDDTISGSAESTKGPVPNLRIFRHVGQEEVSGRGSRPQDDDSTRPAVLELQQGLGVLSGRSEATNEGGAVSSQVVIWCDLNDEQRAIEAALKECGISYSSLYGSLAIDKREALLADWRSKKTAAFVSKPGMYGAGVNLQQAATAIFVGIGFKFYDLIQAVHRIFRFLQTQPVHIHLVYTEAEREVRRVLEEKWAKHNELVAQMTAIIRQYGLATNALNSELARTVGVERSEVQGENFTLVRNDAILETSEMPANSVHLILTSVPFSTQYEYCPSYNDFGHNDDNKKFFEQMDFLTPQLLRILQPGRICAIHVKDRIVPGGMTGLGFQTAYPFHADCIYHYQKHGFAYLGMKTIVTDVVRENNQTYRLGWTEQCKDGSRMGVGMPEYLLLFRKPPSDSGNGYADVPVVKLKEKYSRSRWQIDAHAFSRSNGNRLLSPEDFDNVPHERIFKLFRRWSQTQVYDYEQHVKLGESLETCQECGHMHILPTGYCKCGCRGAGRLPVTFMLLQPQSWHEDVWTDVTRMLSLNSAQSAAGREMHLCPMQFDLADRAIAQYTMEGETVFDPFAGIGTVPLRALKLRRKGYGVELAEGYFRDAVYYCQAAEREVESPTLFDLTEEEEVPA